MRPLMTTGESCAMLCVAGCPPAFMHCCTTPINRQRGPHHGLVGGMVCQARLRPSGTRVDVVPAGLTQGGGQGGGINVQGGKQGADLCIGKLAALLREHLASHNKRAIANPYLGSTAWVGWGGVGG